MQILLFRFSLKPKTDLACIDLLIYTTSLFLEHVHYVQAISCLNKCIMFHIKSFVPFRFKLVGLERFSTEFKMLYKINHLGLTLLWLQLLEFYGNANHKSHSAFQNYLVNIKAFPYNPIIIPAAV